MKLFATRSSYARFATTLIEPVHNYWRSNDNSSLSGARQTLRESSSTYRKGEAKYELQLEGWLAPSKRFRLTSQALLKINPGFEVSVKRTHRPDVSAHLRSASRRLGFRVVVSWPETDPAPRFVFGVEGRHGLIAPVHVSPEVLAEIAAGSYEHTGIRLSHADPVAGKQPRGVLDSVFERSRVVQDDPRAWLLPLVSQHPGEVLELAQGDGMENAAAVIATISTDAAMDVEWADRLVALGDGQLVYPRSELKFSEVIRPVPVKSVTSVSHVMMPQFQRLGSRLRAVDSSVPIPAPAQGWLHLADAVVQDGGTVFSGGALVAYEKAADPTLDFVAGQWDSIYGNGRQPGSALVRHREPSARTFESGVLLSGRNDNNWYHWLIEYLPRAFQLDESIPHDVPFVISERTPQSAFDALRAASDREIIRIDSSLANHFETLHVLAPPVQILDTPRVPWRRGLSMNTAPLIAARSRWLNPGTGASGDRVFLQRRSAHRGLTNEAALVEIAVKNGLRVVDPGQLNWARQLELFSTAQLVVGASGAVMGNYLLMAPKSEILAFSSKPLGDFVLPAAIARVAGANFSYVLGPPTTRLEDHSNRNLWLHSNFSVAPKQFTSALGDVLGQLG